MGAGAWIISWAVLSYGLDPGIYDTQQYNSPSENRLILPAQLGLGEVQGERALETGRGLDDFDGLLRCSRASSLRQTGEGVGDGRKGS